MIFGDKGHGCLHFFMIFGDEIHGCLHFFLMGVFTFFSSLFSSLFVGVFTFCLHFLVTLLSPSLLLALPNDKQSGFAQFPGFRLYY